MTFEEFVHAEMAELARFSGALCGDRHLAEDVLSDALLTASSRWGRISGMQQRVAYVQQIVLSTFLSETRKRRRRRTEVTADPAVLEQADLDTYRAVDNRDEVRRLLAGLTSRQRAAVVLRVPVRPDRRRDRRGARLLHRHCPLAPVTCQGGAATGGS